jgi:N-acetyl-anhydromuramyl-L-alanine amidase AmpD
MLLQQGDQGNAVFEVQATLESFGYKVSATGDFNVKTKNVVQQFQKENGLTIDGFVGSQTWEAIEFSKFEPRGLCLYSMPLPETQYYRSKYNKNQITLHHTASGPFAYQVYNAWASNDTRVATPYVINRAGIVFSFFNDAYWAYHLGVSTSNNTRLNAQSIPIEICNWSFLSHDGNGFKSWADSSVYDFDVIDYGKTGWGDFRGKRYFQKYTNAQITSLQNLIKRLMDTYGIRFNREINENWFTYSNEAMNETSGIWHHVNYREDKFDLHPQPELISSLNNI